MMTFPEQFRDPLDGTPFASKEGDLFGVFLIHRKALTKTTYSRSLKVIATDGEDTEWEHVSVSLTNNSKSCPSWEEMRYVKSLFWEPEDCVVEFHVGESNHISFAEVLHLWRWKNGTFPQPPKICV